MNTKQQIQVVSVDRPKQRCVMNAQGNIIKRGTLEDCRDFLKCNAQFLGYVIV
jgi:hypothetical protein